MKLFALFFLFFITLACQCFAQNYTATWERVYPINSPVELIWPSMVQISNNKVLLFGGMNQYSKPYDQNDTWIFELNDTNWTKIETGIKPTSRFGHNMLIIDSNTLFMFGGSQSIDKINYFSDTWYFHLDTKKWELLPINSEYSHSNSKFLGACKLNNDTILVAGYNIYCCDVNYYYLINQKKWDYDRNNSLSPKVNGWQLADLSENGVLGFGGFSYESQESTFKTWHMDKSSLKWEELFPENNPPKTSNYAMQKITNNDVFIFGGGVSGNDTCRYSRELWLYDFKKNNWFNITPSKSPRYRTGHQMAKLNDTTFLMFGGAGDCYPYKESDTNDTWLLHLKRNVTSFDAELISNEIEYKEAQNIIQISNLESGTFIQVFDVLGNIVETKHVANNPIQINKLDYPIGLYLIQVQIGNKTITNKFIGLR